MIARLCSLSKRVKSSDQCCNKLQVLTGRLMLTRTWHCKMHTSCTLLGNALRVSASRKKKAWISEQSLQLVRQKRVAVRVWTHLRRKWRWSMLERISEVWKAVKSGKTPIFILQMHQVRMCAMRSIIANERNMARLGDVLKKSLKDDKNKHVQSIVNAAFAERASGDGQGLLERRSCSAKSWFRWCSDDCSGEWRSCPYTVCRKAKVATALSRSFCVVKSFPAVNVLLLRGRITIVEPEADLVPTMSEVIARFSQLRIGKAVGEDHLGGELYHTFPHELARIMHPVFAKAALRPCEPWLWRGCLVHELPNKGKDLNLCDAYRDIRTGV